MRLQDSAGIYHVLEKLIKNSPDPVTCNTVFENPEVKKYASTANRVSDYLGHMYRRGVLGRVPAPKSLYDQSRWAYFWKTSEEKPSAKIATLTSVPAAQKPRGAATQILKRPNVEISETGSSILIELPDLVITIRKK